MLPACKSGNTNTFALPATFEPGAFCFPTDSTILASNCNSPSIGSSGAISWASLVALATFSANGCFAEPFVENERNATFGSISYSFAVSALTTPTSANCSSDNSMLMAMSENTYLSPFGPIITIAPDTSFVPGFVLMI